MSKAAISLTTGLEDAEKVTVAFLVSVGAAEAGRETLMFLTKEAVRLAVEGFPRAVACEGCPPLSDLMDRYAAAGGRYIACGVCVKAKAIDPRLWWETPRSPAPSSCGSGSVRRRSPPSASDRP